MLPYHKLTRAGRFRRMRPFALKALENYSVSVKKMSALNDFTNMLFKIQTTDNKKYILRLCSPDWRTDTDCYSEVEWLLALHRDTDIQAPVPLLTRNGEHYTQVKVNDRFSLRFVVLSWLPGTLLLYRLNPVNIEKMGRLFARLHIHGARFKPSPHFSKRSMNKVLAREEKNMLFSPDILNSLTTSQRKNLEVSRNVVRDVYRQRYISPRNIQVIHHDLHHENILIHKGVLQPFDFEDTVWGYPIQDIAMALLDLLDEVGVDRYRELFPYFRKGYETLLPWPSLNREEMRGFQLGRRLWMANSHACYEPEKLPEFLESTGIDSLPQVE